MPYQEPPKDIKMPSISSDSEKKVKDIQEKQKAKICEQTYGGMYDFASHTCKDKTKSGM